MNTVTLDREGSIAGMNAAQQAEMHRDFAQYDAVRRIERWSIREFMRENAALLTGRVLDYGCGDMPYKDLVRGEYVPYEPTDKHPRMAQVSFDAIMCNQVSQYVNRFDKTLREMYHSLKHEGHLVMTFATNWDEVEDTDLFRYTNVGMSMLLELAGFYVVKCERRAQVTHGLFKFPLGYGVVARKDAA